MLLPAGLGGGKNTASRPRQEQLKFYPQEPRNTYIKQCTQAPHRCYKYSSQSNALTCPDSYTNGMTCTFLLALDSSGRCTALSLPSLIYQRARQVRLLMVSFWLVFLLIFYRFKAATELATVSGQIPLILSYVGLSELNRFGRRQSTRLEWRINRGRNL